jgi:glycosyltransferase involved in cell wall biosynthesis
MTGTVPTVRLITRLNVGGPARQALLLSRALQDDFPTVLAAGHPSASEGELSDERVSVRRVPLTRTLHPGMDAKALSAVRRLLGETRARLLHTHMAKAGTIGRVAAATVPRRPRTVHTFHGHVLEGYFSPAVQRGFIEVERALARRTDVLVAVSPEIRDALQSLGIGTRREFQVIPLGLDLEPFLAVTGPGRGLRTHLGLGPDQPLIGIVGRLVPIKGLEVMLETMTFLPHVHLAVVGDGEERTALTERARAAGIADRVHFVGWWPDIPSAMSDCDVITLTSRNEGTPVALIEALAAARPVVATDVGGVRHVIQDGVTGWLAPAGDARSVAALIQRALDDPGTAAAQGLAGRESVRTRFGQDRLVADIRELYTDLLGHPGAG